MPYKKISFFVLVGLLLLTINNLAHSIYTTWQKKDLIVKEQQELDKTTAENQHLKQALAQVKKPEFVESEARNKLFLAKQGEGIVVIPTAGLVASPSSSPKPADTRPNWQRWWGVFF